MPDESSNIAAGSVDLLKILMLAGSLIGMVSTFMLWFSMDFILVQFDYNGFDFFLRSLDLPESYPKIGYYAFMPLVVFAASVFSLIPSLLSFTKRERKAAFAGIACGIIVLVSTLLYVLYPLSKIAFTSPAADMIVDIRLMDNLGAGVYSAAFAGVLLMLGGAIILFHRNSVVDKEDAEESKEQYMETH